MIEESPHRSMLGTLVQRRVAALVVLGVLLLGAITLIVILPHQFQSQFDVLVRNKLPLSARVNATLQETVDEQRMQSETDLLRSPELAAQVVDPDYPTQPDTTHSAADIKRHQAAVALFSRQLVTSVAPGSNLIHVVVTAPDPHRAGALASRLLEVFFASQSEVTHPTPVTAFFIAEADRARIAWQEAQLSLDGLRLSRLVIPTGNAVEMTLQIAALNHQIQRNDEQIDATIGRILLGERKLITIPAHPVDARNRSRNRSASMPLLSIAQLNAMLAIYNDEQAILLTRPPSDVEAVRSTLFLARQVSEAGAARRFAEQSAAADGDAPANSLWQSTTDAIAQSGAELRALYASRAGLASQLAGFQARLDAAQHPSALLVALQTKAAALENSLRLADQRANEARIADAMDQQLRLNVAVVSRPTFSNTAVSPGPWIYGVTAFLAVLFLAVASVTLFAGRPEGEATERGVYNEDKEDEEDEENEENEEDESDDKEFGEEALLYAQTRQTTPFPSGVRSSPSGAFLYAAPGRSVPNAHDSAPPSREVPQSDPQPHPEEPPVVRQSATHSSPEAQILAPHQYTLGDARLGDSSGRSTVVDPQQPPVRQTSSETHAAVPSFFAAPPTASFTLEPEEDHDLAREEDPSSYATYPAYPTPDLLPEFTPPGPYAGQSAFAEPIMLSPEPVSPSSSLQDQTSAPATETILTTPESEPPWSQPFSEFIPPIASWSSVYRSDPLPAPSEPDPSEVEPASIEPNPTRPQATPAPAASTSVPPLAPQALPQTITSTISPSPFLSSVTSTLSAPAFRFSQPPPRKTTPAAAPTPPVPPPAVPPPAIQQPASSPRPILPTFQPVPANTEPDSRLILSYHASEPIELVPDPVLPPIKLPYTLVVPQSAEPTSEPVRPPTPELSEFPLYRAPRPPGPEKAPPPPASANTPHSRTYEEMVQALVYPEETAPYVPPARPTPSPRRAEPMPVPLHLVQPLPHPVDDEAPPFRYARKTVPQSPPAEPAQTPRSDFETLQKFIRRPSIPQTPPPEPTRPSWIDLAPPPPPPAEDIDPQKRAPDHISAIRNQSNSRGANLVDESGNRLTPSQRLRQGRPIPTYDKDGNISYADYLKDQNKDRS